MEVTGIKFAFILSGEEGTEQDFREQHFRQHGPALAGRCIENIKYQIFDAVCEYGVHFAYDPRITATDLEDELKVAFCNLNYRGVYYLVLDQVGKRVYFIWIPSNSNSIFALYDVR